MSLWPLGFGKVPVVKQSRRHGRGRDVCVSGAHSQFLNGTNSPIVLVMTSGQPSFSPKRKEKHQESWLRSAPLEMCWDCACD